MAEKRPIQDLMGVTMEKMREMVDVQTIIGDPIVVSDKVTIVPVSKVSYGFASGGSDLAVPVPACPFSRLPFWWYRRTACGCCKWTRAAMLCPVPFARCRKW